ncbi:hypothetical protein Rhal01_01467 [Rubritalea halochordaticola]|uniref:Uncharacterized protein n=1 Tax=Rubritalea halochordaticola TaxID=714537 RepID=A0ABP9V3T1_9BACT
MSVRSEHLMTQLASLGLMVLGAIFEALEVSVAIEVED